MIVPEQMAEFDLRLTALELAAASGVELQDSRPGTRRLWEARALALHRLAAGNMPEALKVMAPFKKEKHG